MIFKSAADAMNIMLSPCPSPIAYPDRGYAVFARILTHDERGSNHIVSRRNSSGWHEACAASSALGAYEPALWPRDDTYVSLNGFVGRRRRENRLRQINGFVLDLDCHGGGFDLPSSLAAIDAAVAGGSLPKPTMVVSTGRGLHLHYILGKSLPYRLKAREGGRAKINRTAVDFLRDVSRDAAAAAERAVAGTGLAVDRSSLDLARVVRVPGTYNTSAEAFCELVRADEGAMWTLQELRDVLPRAGGGKPRRATAMVRFDRLLLHRARKIEMLRDLRELGGGDMRCEGTCRNDMLFAYANTVSQIYGKDAVGGLAERFNSAYARPLPGEEVACIVSSCLRNGPYRISAETLVGKFLRATERELREIGFFASSRQMDRMCKKIETARKREARDGRVAELASRGLTQVEIARECGLSRQTVAKILRSRHQRKRAASSMERPGAPNAGELLGRAPEAKRGAMRRAPGMLKKLAHVQGVCTTAGHESRLRVAYGMDPLANGRRMAPRSLRHGSVLRTMRFAL